MHFHSEIPLDTYYNPYLDVDHNNVYLYTSIDRIMEAHRAGPQKPHFNTEAHRGHLNHFFMLDEC